MRCMQELLLNKEKFGPSRSKSNLFSFSFFTNSSLTDRFQDCRTRQRQMMFEEVLMEIYSGLSRDRCYQMLGLPDSLKTQDLTMKRPS